MSICLFCLCLHLFSSLSPSILVCVSKCLFLSLFLFTFLCLHLFSSLSVYLFFCASIFSRIYVSICLSICLFFRIYSYRCVFVCPPSFLVSMSIYLPVPPSSLVSMRLIYLFSCLCVSTYLSVCLSVCVLEWIITTPQSRRIYDGGATGKTPVAAVDRKLFVYILCRTTLAFFSSFSTATVSPSLIGSFDDGNKSEQNNV